MRQYLATVYAFAFHDPKPLHPLIIKNWASVGCCRFVILTDRSMLWQKIVPESGSNIFIHQIDIEELFRRSFGIFEVNNFTDFKNKKGWLFHKTEFEMNGYLACQLRPALSTMFPQRRTKLWGWIDNDVLIDSASLEKHISNDNSELVLYPETGFMWEQFKLFSADLNTSAIYKDIVDFNEDEKIMSTAPLEAIFVYHIKDIGRFRQDKIAQKSIAIHWAFTDRLAIVEGRLDNQYDVTITSDLRLTGGNGQNPIFFNADNQVKLFNAEQAAQVEDSLIRFGSHTFVHEPWL